MAIRHVLFDADGVLQMIPGGWYAALEPYLGDRSRDFLHETWREELPMLAGRGDYLPVLADGLARFDVRDDPWDVYRAVWHRIEVNDASIGLVHELRAAGYGVHLGTNQESHREAYMRTELGYDALFDVSCYSCDLGAAKPSTAFFDEAVRRIGADPDEVVFIDDVERNVLGAREAGLRAVLWCLEDGHDELRRLLAEHDVAVGTGDVVPGTVLEA